MKELADKVSLCVKELNQSIVSSSDADVLQVLKDTLSIFLALATELDKAKAAGMIMSVCIHRVLYMHLQLSVIKCPVLQFFNRLQGRLLVKEK